MEEIIREQRLIIIGLSILSFALVAMLVCAAVEINSVKKAYNRKLRTTTLRQRFCKMFRVKCIKKMFGRTEVKPQQS